MGDDQRPRVRVTGVRLPGCRFHRRTRGSPTTQEPAPRAVEQDLPPPQAHAALGRVTRAGFKCSHSARNLEHLLSGAPPSIYLACVPQSRQSLSCGPNRARAFPVRH